MRLQLFHLCKVMNLLNFRTKASRVYDKCLIRMYTEIVKVMHYQVETGGVLYIVVE